MATTKTDSTRGHWIEKHEHSIFLLDGDTDKDGDGSWTYRDVATTMAGVTLLSGL